MCGRAVNHFVPLGVEIPGDVLQVALTATPLGVGGITPAQQQYLHNFIYPNAS